MSSSTATSNELRTFVRRASGFAATLLAVYLVAVFVFDPYYKIHCRLDPIGKPRLMAPALIKQLGPSYDAALLGSSMADNFSTAKLHETLGIQTMKLSLPGSTFHEQARVADYALKQPTIKTIIWGVDLLAARGAVNSDSPMFPMPDYLYHDDWLSYVRYVADPSVVQDLPAGVLRSLRSMRGDGGFDMESYLKLTSDESLFGKRYVQADFALKRFDAIAPLEDYAFELLQQNYQHNLRRVIAANPSIRFILFYPPYSSLAWQRLLEKGNFDSLLRFKQVMTDDFLGFPNVELHDFQVCFEITHNLDLYRDVAHYHPIVNDRMAEWFKTGEWRVTKASAAAAITALREDALREQREISSQSASR